MSRYLLDDAFARLWREMPIVNVWFATTLLKLMRNPLAFRLGRWQSIHKSSGVIGKILVTVFRELTHYGVPTIYHRLPGLNQFPLTGFRQSVTFHDTRCDRLSLCADVG